MGLQAAAVARLAARVALVARGVRQGSATVAAQLNAGQRPAAPARRTVAGFPQASEYEIRIEPLRKLGYSACSREERASGDDA